jgi:hypothetical protein
MSDTEEQLKPCSFNDDPPSYFSEDANTYTNTNTQKYGLYEDILREIRNMTVLKPYQLHYLRGVSNGQLMQIIEIYNLIMRNVNEIL